MVRIIFKDPMYILSTFGWPTCYQMTDTHDYKNLIMDKEAWPTNRVPSLPSGCLWEPSTLVFDYGEDVCGTGRPPSVNRHLRVSMNCFRGSLMVHLRRNVQDRTEGTREMYLNFSTRYDLPRLMSSLTTLMKYCGQPEDIQVLKSCMQKSLEKLNE